MAVGEARSASTLSKGATLMRIPGGSGGGSLKRIHGDRSLKRIPDDGRKSPDPFDDLFDELHPHLADATSHADDDKSMLDHNPNRRLDHRRRKAEHEADAQSNERVRAALRLQAHARRRQVQRTLAARFARLTPPDDDGDDDSNTPATGSAASGWKKIGKIRRLSAANRVFVQAGAEATAKKKHEIIASRWGKAGMSATCASATMRFSTYQAATKCQASFRGIRVRRERDGDEPAAVYGRRKDARAAAKRAQVKEAAARRLQARVRGGRERQAVWFVRVRAIHAFAGEHAGDLPLCEGDVLLVHRGEWEMARTMRKVHLEAQQEAAAAAAKAKKPKAKAKASEAIEALGDHEGASWIHARLIKRVATAQEGEAKGAEEGVFPSSYVIEIGRPPDWVLAIRERDGHYDINDLSFATSARTSRASAESLSDDSASELS